jgi:spermidine/putrescine transport system ATP-binding protein
MSDTIVVMNKGKIQQMGSPEDIYNEPKNSFVARFIGESNIFDGTMLDDFKVEFCEKMFNCVDKGFEKNENIEVVIRPEDIDIVPYGQGQFNGTIISKLFIGVHYEMLVQLPNGYELMVQDYNAFEPDTEVSLIIKPADIHVMKKERTCNTFEATVVDENHIEMLGANFECLPHGLEKGAEAKVEVDFDKIDLTDDKEDGALEGDVRLILYKGNHYHLTIVTDEDDYLYVDTNDVWDDGDMVGINILPEDIRIVNE